MALPTQNSSHLLCAEILDQARRESEEILRRAQQQADAVLADAAAEAQKLNQEDLAKARAQGARQTELILATLPIEAQRLRSSRTEALLESIREAVLKRLLAREGFDYRRALVVIAADALHQMEGDVFTVKLSPPDYLQFGVGLAQDIARQVETSSMRVTVAEDPDVTGGGLIVQDSEGRQVVDNCFQVRLQRLWPELRRQIAVQVDQWRQLQQEHEC